MIEIYKNLFIGNQDDYENDVKNNKDWVIVHACKEPYHRQLLKYSERGAPKNHPEYLYAERKNRLYLNLVDAPKSEYISEEIIDKTLIYIKYKLKENKKILVHCNQGMSRSAIIGMLFLASIGKFSGKNFENAEKEYKKIYFDYNPSSGVKGYAMINWDKYCK